MKFAFALALGVALGAVTLPAYAQLGSVGMGGAGGGPKAQPEDQAPNLAPSGLPGLGSATQQPQTGPTLQKTVSGDPTQNLFIAVNNNDYAAAQAAVSHGADLNATNQFGETPLDMAIALNRNDITFLLLGTRNELGAQGYGEKLGAPILLNTPTPGKSHTPRATPHKATPKPSPAVRPLPDLPGTPDPQAGFLGFGRKSG